jgi:hypothetical protein
MKVAMKEKPSRWNRKPQKQVTRNRVIRAIQHLLRSLNPKTVTTLQFRGATSAVTKTNQDENRSQHVLMDTATKEQNEQPPTLALGLQMEARPLERLTHTTQPEPTPIRGNSNDNLIQ